MSGMGFKLGHAVSFSCTLAVVGMAAPPETPSLRIVSPVNGAVVRPGHTLAVKVTGVGEYKALAALISDFVGGGELLAPASKPPWTITLDIPLNAQLGKHVLVVMGQTVSGLEVEPAETELDVEPMTIPPLDFEPPVLSILSGSCVDLGNGKAEGPCEQTLIVSGTYPDGTGVDVMRSTRVNVISRDSAIVTVAKNGCCLVGVSSGSTKVVFFGKFMIDITVRARR